MKLKVQAQYLQIGDRVGSGEIVEYVGAGIRTPKGCVDVVVSKAGKKRSAYWRKYSMINIERLETIEEMDDRNITACHPIVE